MAAGDPRAGPRATAAPPPRQDRDRLPWAKDRLPALLIGATSDCGRARVTGVTISEGEAYQATRKGGKRFSHFDLALTVTYEKVSEGGGGGSGGGEGGAGSTVAVAEFCAGADAADLVLDPPSAPPLRAALAAAAAALLAELEALAV